VAEDTSLIDHVTPVSIRTVSAAHVADRLQVIPAKAPEALHPVTAIAAVSDAVNAGGEISIEVLIAETFVKRHAGFGVDVKPVQIRVTA
jgi:hypothetical protein